MRFGEKILREGHVSSFEGGGGPFARGAMFLLSRGGGGIGMGGPLAWGGGGDHCATNQTGTGCCLEVTAWVRLSNVSWAVKVSSSPSHCHGRVGLKQVASWESGGVDKLHKECGESPHATEVLIKEYDY